VTQMSPGRQATSLFQERFGSRPALLVSAPGRLNLLGEHTDYNGGPVLPLALERRTWVAAGPAPVWEAVSALDGALPTRIDPDRMPGGHWTAYTAGVIRALTRAGLAPSGARLAVVSTVPVGAGLSSSAALTVATARALAALAGHRPSPAGLIELAFRAEHDEVGVRCGRMDQTISVMARAGHALLFETGPGTVTQVPMPGRIWLLETGVSHRLAGGEFNARRRECEEALRLAREQGLSAETLAQISPPELATLERTLPAPWIRRLRHVVRETARTRSAAAALTRGNLKALGRLLVEGHESLRQDFQSSCPEADLLVESAVGLGAYGARLTGAGWGGAVIALLPPGREARITAEVAEAFRLRFGRIPVMWNTRAASGVRTEKRPSGTASGRS
jgi:galactokinase